MQLHQALLPCVVLRLQSVKSADVHLDVGPLLYCRKVKRRLDYSFVVVGVVVVGRIVVVDSTRKDFVMTNRALSGHAAMRVVANMYSLGTIDWKKSRLYRRCLRLNLLTSDGGRGERV